MALEIRISDLGIVGDDTVIRGTTPIDVVRQVIAYLRREHKVDMPDAEYVLNDDQTGAVVAVPGANTGRPEGAVTAADTGTDEGARVIVQRLREAVEIPTGRQDLAGPGT